MVVLTFRPVLGSNASDESNKVYRYYVHFFSFVDRTLSRKGTRRKNKKSKRKGNDLDV